MRWPGRPRFWTVFNMFTGVARQHLPSGWAGEHPDLADTAHQLWADEISAFRTGWSRITAAA
ncbi:hypothetical protein SR41_00630 [Sphingomonas melonis]|uniref:Uncharacterized protein n=1 Tax=Sphingomonas melonis TaxID=152682 RepID=A0A0D1MIK1_9SPHN|nr:hypothetical protein SR41_00630 [Sphingomonas melonis]